MADNYRDPTIWISGMTLVTEIYKFTAKFPATETYGLTIQMRRAAVSIPSHIAEGHGHRTSGEFLQYLIQARGSLLELETQLQISVNLGYTDLPSAKRLFEKTSGLGKAINAMITAVKHQKPGPKPTADR